MHPYNGNSVQDDGIPKIVHGFAIVTPSLLHFIFRSHDIRSQSGLTRLYNQNVVKAEHVERPMPGAFGLKHSGVRVTTNDGKSSLLCAN